MNKSIRSQLSSLIYACCLMTFPLQAAPIPQDHLYTIKPQMISKPLYFSGSISPIENVPAISPTQGIVDKMYVSYGQLVHKGEKIAHINTKKLENDIRDAKVSYLDALHKYHSNLNWQTSENYLDAQSNLQKAERALKEAQETAKENQALFKYGIISAMELHQSEDALSDSKSSLAQSKRSLAQLSSQSEGSNLTISHLQLQNTEDKYHSLLQQQKDTMIYAPASGIALKPDSSDSASGTSGSGASGTNSSIVVGSIVVGGSVSFQQVIMNIGNMSGLRINISIPENNINQIQVGQEATITGAGFPGITLKGEVSSVAAQASGDSQGGGGIPSFPVGIEVKNLTDVQKKLIKSGMDAQVAIVVYQKADQLTIPLNAVYTDSDTQKNWVRIYDPNTKKASKVEVTTGNVLLSTVQVLTGLSAGQMVIVPYHFGLKTTSSS